MLIKTGTDFNLWDQYKTPLTIACKQCHLNIVVVLIQTGANVNLSDGTYTPLTIAFEQEQTKAFQKIVKIGTDFDVKFES